jgi:hypothetical protein
MAPLTLHGLSETPAGQQQALAIVRSAVLAPRRHAQPSAARALIPGDDSGNDGERTTS